MRQQIVQGRPICEVEIALIQQLCQEHPQWSRTELSRHLAEHWNWRNGTGQLKDMAARTLLLKLQRRGLVELPPSRKPNNNGKRRAQPPTEGEGELAFRCDDITGPLSALGPLHVELVSSSAQRAQVRGSLARHHYLGFGGAVGQNLQYLIYDRSARLVAVSVFGSGAWKCAPRDQFIGWNPSQRRERLHLVTNQQRFLILPWVKVPHLGSHLLGLMEKRLSRDWQSRYGHPVVLMESFVEQERFKGTIYKAANWICVGQTTGRSRNDSGRTLAVPVKSVWVRALCADFRAALLSGS